MNFEKFEKEINYWTYGRILCNPERAKFEVLSLCQKATSITQHVLVSQKLNEISEIVDRKLYKVY